MDVIIVGTIFVLITTYWYFKTSFQYWQNRKVPSLEPTFPLGNITLQFFSKMGQELKQLYNNFKSKGHKYGGIYMATRKVFLPLDPELIKQILTKDFQSFHDRGLYVNEEREFMTAHLFAITGNKWKSLRSKFTSFFTTSKIKVLLDLIIKNASRSEDYLQTRIKDNIPIDIRDLTDRITNDIFCSIAFGIDCNSLVNPDEEFGKLAKVYVTNNMTQRAKMICCMTWPGLFDFCRFKFVKPEFSEPFIRAITDIVQYREKHNIQRPDVMDCLINMKNCEENNITLKQLITQSFVFYTGGYETSSSTICYCMFELSQNQDIQNKVRTEIHEILKKYDGKITYEAIQEMQYLDQVVLETLRKYPAVVILNRIANEDWTIPGTDSVIEKDTSIFISVLGLHHDPEYYPEPEKFDPERFSNEEKLKRPSYAYLPFGEGPRNCIAFKLGLVQIKVAIISLLNKFKYSLNSQTKLPLEFKTEILFTSHYNTIWIDAEQI